MTLEIEENGKMPFLECLITRENNRLRTTFTENEHVPDRLLNLMFHWATITTAP